MTGISLSLSIAPKVYKVYHRYTINRQIIAKGRPSAKQRKIKSRGVIIGFKSIIKMFLKYHLKK